MTELPARRLLLVHAHPDDESINNGVTMARYAAEGAHVTLVTCTLGGRGEVIPPELGHLTGAALGGHRRGELAAAMRALGVEDFRLLGGPGRFADSGMMGLPDNDDPRLPAAGGRRPGRRTPRRGDPRGASPGARHLRPRRRLRPPRPHPGPPHRHARRRAGGRGGVPGRQGLLEPRPRTVAEDAFARLRDDLPGLPFEEGGRRREPTGRRRRRADHHRDPGRRRRERRQDRGHARARHADHRRRAVLRPLQRTGPAGLHHRVLRTGAR